MKIATYLLCTVACVALGAAPAAAQTTIAAASDLQVALPELVSRFERTTGARLQVVYGSSGNLSAQIERGAPYDVFLSADMEYPRRLAGRGVANRSAIVPYATGRLVLWTRKESKVNLAAGLEGLVASSVRRIAIANASHAPYGRAAVAALRHAGVYDRVANRLVVGENISQAAQFGQSGNAEVAIIALSLAVGPALRGVGRYVKIPTNAYPPLEQAAIVLTRAKRPDEARRFVEFLRQPDVLAYLQTMGFGPPVR